MPGSWGHLARRFLWSLRVAPLTATEHVEISALIEGPVLDMYLEQDTADRRHGLEAARFVLQRGGRQELAVAALVHDVGKRHARLGVIGRTLASVLARLHLPTPGRLGVYLDHPRRGAADLAALGLAGVVIDFTAWHHGPRPDSISPEDWDLLLGGDATVTNAGTPDN